MGELQFVIALLIKKYHITLAPGETGEWLEKDLRDQFTAAPGRLNLRFTPRSSSQTTPSLDRRYLG